MHIWNQKEMTPIQPSDRYNSTQTHRLIDDVILQNSTI